MSLYGSNEKEKKRKEGKTMISVRGGSDIDSRNSISQRFVTAMTFTNA